MLLIRRPLRPEPKHLSDMAILVSRRHELANMHVQLAPVDAAKPAARGRPEDFPCALEGVGAAAALVQWDAGWVGFAVGGVEVAAGEAEDGAVDGVEVGEDEEVDFSGEGEEGECAAPAGCCGGCCCCCGCGCGYLSCDGRGGDERSDKMWDESAREGCMWRIDSCRMKQCSIIDDFSRGHCVTLNFVPREVFGFYGQTSPKSVSRQKQGEQRHYGAVPCVVYWSRMTADASGEAFVCWVTDGARRCDLVG